MRHFSSNKHHFGACPIQFTPALMIDAISENLEGVVVAAYRMIKMRKFPNIYEELSFNPFRRVQLLSGVTGR